MIDRVSHTRSCIFFYSIKADSCYDQWMNQKVVDEESTQDKSRGNIFTEAEMQELWNDLQHVVKPSWVSSVPYNISSISNPTSGDPLGPCSFP